MGMGDLAQLALCKLFPHKNPQRKVNHSEKSGRWKGIWEYVWMQDLPTCEELGPKLGANWE